MCWGRVRSGATSDVNKSKYVGNLGHVQDDGSQYIYMRARYYDPVVGRFISEDASQHGPNWFTYARNNPVHFTDHNGNIASEATWVAVYAAVVAWIGSALVSRHARGIVGAGSVFMLAWYGWGRESYQNDMLNARGDPEVNIALLMMYGSVFAGIGAAGAGMFAPAGTIGPLEGIGGLCAYLDFISIFITLEALVEQ